MEIRLATIEDAAAIRRIYEPYVLNTAISFEYDVPSVEDFQQRISNTLINYPYYVAVLDDKVVGYVYAGVFHSRVAYSHSVEMSIYLDESVKGKGIGRALYNKMEQTLASQNICMVHACIASPDEEDERLTDDSEKFHAKMGYKLAGRHDRCGYKFGKWYSIVWMDKVIGEKSGTIGDFIPFSKLRQ